MYTSHTYTVYTNIAQELTWAVLSSPLSQQTFSSVAERENHNNNHQDPITESHSNHTHPLTGRWRRSGLSESFFLRRGGAASKGEPFSTIFTLRKFPREFTGEIKSSAPSSAVGHKSHDSIHTSRSQVSDHMTLWGRGIIHVHDACMRSHVRALSSLSRRAYSQMSFPARENHSSVPRQSRQRLMGSRWSWKV